MAILIIKYWFVLVNLTRLSSPPLELVLGHTDNVDCDRFNYNDNDDDGKRNWASRLGEKTCFKQHKRLSNSIRFLLRNQSQEVVVQLKIIKMKSDFQIQKAFIKQFAWSIWRSALLSNWLPTYHHHYQINWSCQRKHKLKLDIILFSQNIIHKSWGLTYKYLTA